MNDEIVDALRREPESLEVVAEAIDTLSASSDERSDGAGIEALAEETGHPAHLFLLSEKLHRQGRFAEAGQALRRAHDNPEPAGFFFKLVGRFPPRWQERIRFYWLERMFGLEGQDVVEVGGQMPSEFVLAARPSTWTCIDPKIEHALDEGSYRRLRGDASRMPFPDGSVDRVFSSSAFEHFEDLPGALQEMYRVLRKGGIVYSDFGPIWSSAEGHHVRGAAMRILEEAGLWPLPAWAHLLMNRTQMEEFLSSSVSADAIKTVLHGIYGRRTINRLFHEDYVHHFHACPLRVVRIDPKLGDPPDERTAKALHRRQPGRANFHVKGFRVVLRKA